MFFSMTENNFGVLSCELSFMSPWHHITNTDNDIDYERERTEP